MYNDAPYSGTIYANAAASGCPGSTTIGGSTISATATPVGGQDYSQATLTGLTPDVDYTFFFVVAGGPTVSYCGIEWTYGTVYLSYP